MTPRGSVSLLPQSTTAGASKLRLLFDNQEVEAEVKTERDRLRARIEASPHASGTTTLSSALPGVIRRILLGPGASVDRGTAILTLEAMKMENEVRAEAAGCIQTILVKEGQVVNAGEPLVEILVREGQTADAENT